jgi:hypothetical protein
MHGMGCRGGGPCLFAGFWLFACPPPPTPAPSLPSPPPPPPPRVQSRQRKKSIWKGSHDATSPVTLNSLVLDCVLGPGALDIVKGHDVARGLSVVDVQRVLIRLAGVGVSAGAITAAVELLLPMLPRNRQAVKPNVFALQIRDVRVCLFHALFGARGAGFFRPLSSPLPAPCFCVGPRRAAPRVRPHVGRALVSRPVVSPVPLRRFAPPPPPLPY